jgi:hypothetical protein
VFWNPAKHEEKGRKDGGDVDGGLLWTIFVGKRGVVGDT